MAKSGCILAAVTPDTAAVYYLESGWVAPGAPALSDVIRAARTAEIPVVLDAAAMLPPVENLWAYTAACSAAARTCAVPSPAA